MERKCVLVIGANGQLAKCISDELSGSDWVRSFCDSRRDITDRADISSFIAAIEEDDVVRGGGGLDAIINTAAFHDLRACEADFDTAFRVNAFGVANLLAAMPEGCHLYTIGTDYVFSGCPPDEDRPMTIHDETAPSSDYARTKRAGELIALGSGRATVIRTASLFSKYGSSGKPGKSNFLLGMLKRAGECNCEWIEPDGRDGNRVAAAREDGRVLPLGCTIPVDSDVVMSPTYTPWLARAILSMVADDLRPPLAHMVCDGPPVSWFDFAKAIFETGGFTGALDRLVPKQADEWPPRPRFSALENSPDLGMGTWMAALEEFFEREWPNIVLAPDAPKE